MSLIYWNNMYSKSELTKSNKDFWLDKYETILLRHKNEIMIDLGCGIGDDSIYLVQKGFNVTACDFSEEALKIVNRKIPELKTLRFDMLEGLPFPDTSIGCIISDLSLHYFSNDETRKITSDIKRVLVEDGVFLCRVNSTLDVNYGAMAGEKIEENYFFVEGYKKRFFDEKYIKQIFSDLYIFYIKESVTLKYDKPKLIWEIALSKSIIDFKYST